MKKSNKLSEPPTLQTYRQAQPRGLWEQMRDDPMNEGQQAYYDIKHTLIKGQRGLCAYCETKIVNDLDDETIQAHRQSIRVEHFHSKSDHNSQMNWALHWPNLWAVCNGGESSGKLRPLEHHLSCDAFKGFQIEQGRIPQNPEGYILSPDEIPASPVIFKFKQDGNPCPHEENCSIAELPNNRRSSTETLVSETIRHLNLSCPRLQRNRNIIRGRIEKMIAQERERAPALRPEQVKLRIARRLFPSDPSQPWPQFFSLIRHILGDAAEEHLRFIQFDG